MSGDTGFINQHRALAEMPASLRRRLEGRNALHSAARGYDDAQTHALLKELYDWQTRKEFQYTHRWQAQMLVIWDNRSVLYKANGDYDGYPRELHRTTIGDDPSRYLQPENAH